ncbi:MAG: hypothetical protein FD156_582 [Nitrospirae bacterium]|nr:MAG: hypothetical protein FD156_582 [Nitrospirota bacterium]
MLVRKLDNITNGMLVTPINIMNSNSSVKMLIISFLTVKKISNIIGLTT